MVMFYLYIIPVSIPNLSKNEEKINLFLLFSEWFFNEFLKVAHIQEKKLKVPL